MKYGICTLAVIPVRKDASDKSEMITQLLFGDIVEFLDKSNQWLYIRIAYDDYQGWIDIKQITELSDEEYNQLSTAPSFKVKDLTFPITKKTDNTEIIALMGSSIPYQKNNSFIAGGQHYLINNQTTEIKPSLIDTALKYLNSPYLWGGKTPFGIDCSGFTQMVFKLCDIKLFRDAHQQSEQGRTIDFISETHAGDLVFFDNNKSNITHTGIILENNQIIHASGFVRIDTIDHEGIYNELEQRYTHKLRLIKRII